MNDNFMPAVGQPTTTAALYNGNASTVSIANSTFSSSSLAVANGRATAAESNPKIIYLDRICRTCLVEKEKEQLKDIFELALVDMVMSCANISIIESDGLPCHICLDCFTEVERIDQFRQISAQSDQTIRQLIEKSVVIKQDSETKYEVLNVVLTDSNGNTETSAVVVPIEELRFQLVNGNVSNVQAPTETFNIPIVELNKAVEIQQNVSIVNEITQQQLISFHTNAEVLNSTVDTSGMPFEEDPPLTLNPSELLNEPAPTPPPPTSETSENNAEPKKQRENDLKESAILRNLKRELSEFIGSTDVPKDSEIDDNDDEIMHVDYLKDALTEEYIQIMETQLSTSMPQHAATRVDKDAQLEQENLNILISASMNADENRLQQEQQQLQSHSHHHDPTDNPSEEDTSYCKACDMNFDDNRLYRRHLRKTHSEKRFECSYCLRKFSEQSLLKNHLLRHTGEKTHSCDVCHARFYEKSMLNVHMRRHNGQRPFPCELCSKRFATRTMLNTHMKSHLAPKSHVCTVCQKGFKLSWQLKAHARIHTNEKPFECPYCQKRFNQNGNLMVHIRIHSGERPFQCKFCDKAYPSQGELTGHMRQHTGEKKEKNCVCTVCSKAFAGNCDLKIHMRTHTKEKPYVCTVCAKSFMLHVHLTVHMRSHTGEKPFACTICEKAFATNHQLKNHIYVHTGEKNYVCEVCNRRFSSAANRNTHRKTHNRKIS